MVTNSGGVFTIDNGGTINSTTGQVDPSSLNDGNYTVIYSIAGNCPDTQTFSFSVVTCAMPTAGFTVTDSDICQGTCLTFTDNSTGNPTSWHWSFGGGSPSSSTSQNPGQVCFYHTGTYTVKLIVSNSIGSDTITHIIKVYGIPVINAGVDQTIDNGSEVLLQTSGSTNGIYSWTPSTGLSCSACPSPMASPNETTVYTVTITNPYGCSASDSVMVTVNIIEGIGVPSAFSPNGDNENDVLYVEGDGIVELSFMVYNRYGQLVFESNDPIYGWDGTFKGKPENPGVFAYTVAYTLISGAKGELKGNVTLVK